VHPSKSDQGLDLIELGRLAIEDRCEILSQGQIGRRVDLDRRLLRHHRTPDPTEAAGQAVRVVADKHQGAEQQQWRRLPEPGTGRGSRRWDPGDRRGQGLAPMVCIGVAPSAGEPSRMSASTDRNASRVAMMITGRISRLRAVAPARTRFLFCTRSKVSSASANRP
jgi:hypothetical protein